MKTIKSNDGNPTPTVNLTINKNRAKLYSNGTYYLKNGQTFEIELFNPTKSKIRADIKIDGRIVSGGGLVLNPGERVYLERFMETNNKFLFETYEVEDSKEAQEAISDNGSLTVDFYKETMVTLRPSNDWINYGFDPSKHPDYKGPRITYFGNYTSPINPFYTGDFNVTSTGNDFNVTPIGTGIGTTTTNIVNTSTTNNITFEQSSFTSYGMDFASGPDSSVDCFYSTSVPFDTPDSHGDILTKSSFSTNETGRTEKGETSSQTFESVYATFDYSPFETVEFKLLPLSKKMITSSDTTFKFYCGECGKKVKTAFKFCPNCGDKLI